MILSIVVHGNYTEHSHYLIIDKGIATILHTKRSVTKLMG